MSEEMKKEILSYIRQRHDISDRVSDERLAEIWNLEILFTLEFLSSRTPDLALLREAFERGMEIAAGEDWPYYMLYPEEYAEVAVQDAKRRASNAFTKFLKDKGLVEGV